MPPNAAPRPQFPHLVLANGSIVQLIIVRSGRHLVRRRRPCGHDECCRWPERWRPFRIARRWRFTAHAEDVHLLHGYCAPAALSVRGIALLDTVELTIPGVRVIRL